VWKVVECSVVGGGWWVVGGGSVCQCVSVSVLC
jgi:hypothetical protein